MCPLLNSEPYELAELSDRYYQEEYPKFRGLTRPMPGNRLVMDWAFSHNVQVAIATGYQLPLSAIEERLEWANVPVSEYEYAMITTLRNMHTSKPHIGFYKEILDYLGRAPEECLMIGDRMDDDILPATSVGIPSFWFTENGNESAEQIDLLVGMGDMEDLLAILNSIEVIELKA